MPTTLRTQMAPPRGSENRPSIYQKNARDHQIGPKEPVRLQFFGPVSMVVYVRREASRCAEAQDGLGEKD